MGKKQKKVSVMRLRKKYTLIAGIWAMGMLCLLPGMVIAEQVVGISFSPSSGNWERNSYQTVDVVLTAGNEAVDVAGVELTFSFDPNKFNQVRSSEGNDNITKPPYDLFVDEREVDSVQGTVIYRKAITGDPGPGLQSCFSIGANQSWTAFTVEFWPTSLPAREGATSFTFAPTAAVANRAGGDVTGSVVGATFTIIPDNTAPQTEAVPASCTMNISTYQNVVLRRLSSDPSWDDLETIFYTTDGNDPATGSSQYSSPIVLPQNDAGSPEGVTTVVKFRGRDYDSNLEGVNSETYLVDVVAPVILNVAVDPEYGGQGSEVTVTFEVSETLNGDPSVTVAGGGAIKDSGVFHPSYRYTYTVSGNEPEGWQPVFITLSDVSGNGASDSSEQVKIDFQPATYAVVSLPDTAVGVNESFNIVFNASERLDTNTSVVSIGGVSASFSSESEMGGGIWQYTYNYTRPGDDSEYSNVVLVQGYDLAHNFSTNFDGWGEVVVSGYDLYENEGIAYAEVVDNYNRQSRNTAPSLSADPAGPVSAAVGDIIIIDLEGSDVENNDMLLGVSGSAVDEGGALVDNGDGTGGFTWDTTGVSTGSYEAIFTADDGDESSPVTVSIQLN